MEFITAVGRPDTIETDAIVVGVHADGELTPTAKALDSASKGAIRAAVKSGDMTGKRGTLLPLLRVNGIAAPRCWPGSRQGRLQRAPLYRCSPQQRQSVQRSSEDRHGGGARLAGQEARSPMAGTQRRDRRARSDVSHRRAEEQARSGTDGAQTVGLLLKTRNAAVERSLRNGGIANGMELAKDWVTCHPTSARPAFSRRSTQDGQEMEARHRSARDQAAGSAEDGRILVGGEKVLHSRHG